MFGLNNHYSSVNQYQMDASIHRRCNPLQMPVVNEWKPIGSYASTPIQYWQIQPVEKSEVVKTYPSTSNHYSSAEKMFYGPVPSNTQTFNQACIRGHFGISLLRQTNILEVISTNPRDFGKLMSPYEVSLAKTLVRVSWFVGSIRDADDLYLGTGTLVSNNFMLIARHSIEGMDVRTLKVVFGNFKIPGHGYSKSFKYEFAYVVESHPHLDYAIVKLKNTPGMKHGYAFFSKNISLMSNPALLHYPLGKPLQVSVHAFNQTQYESNRLETYHDSDYNSSGGAYIDPSGFLVAIHLGSELDYYNMNLCRYSLPIQEIINQNPDGLLAKFADGRLDQSEPYISQTPQYYLMPTERSFIFDEEGYPRKILTHYIKREIKDKYRDGKIDFKEIVGDKDLKLDRNNEVVISPESIKYITKNYLTAYQKMKGVYYEELKKRIDPKDIVVLDKEKGDFSYNSVPFYAFSGSIASKFKEWTRTNAERTIKVWEIRKWRPNAQTSWDFHLSVVMDSTGKNVTKFHFTIRKNNKKAESGFAWYTILGHNKGAILLPREDEGTVRFFKDAGVKLVNLDRAAKIIFNGCLSYL